ncbi:MAG: orotate phosphoribosyltransferase [Synechococcaceae cyanobacterium RL_1_2]|nr:orotate phosphoribosyltransferase [Synechococcaceae cyanobacterium RL_1_2]
MNINLATAELTDVRDYILDLIVAHAYQEGDFTLSSGAKSSYYINCKKVSLMATGGLGLGRLFLDLLPENTAAVAGLTLGADPLVSAASVVSAYQHQPLPALILRKKPKGHGTKAYIEGPDLPAGAAITVLEDVVTTGQSALFAVEKLQEAGFVVNEILAIVDREQGGAELYQSQGLNFRPLFTISEVQAHSKKNN